MGNYHIPLVPSRLYHVFSRAIGSEKLFREEENYRYFLVKMRQHLSPVCEVWAYCLLPNHFHFLVEVRCEDDIRSSFEKTKKDKPFQVEIASDFIMERFSNFLNAYTKAFNKRFRRHGALFTNYLKRVEIGEDAHLSTTLFYIHKNPVHHGLVRQIADWKWSSYHSILSDHSSDVQASKVLQWFGGLQSYVEFHKQPIDLKGFEGMD
jgi:REP element-mobilizing transposase RayT